METAVEKFDPSKMIDGVKDRIRATFVSLIPDEAWDKMVKGVVTDYFRFSPGPTGTGDVADIKSPFSMLIKEELDNAVREKLKAYFSSQAWSNSWDGRGRPVASDKIKALIHENIPTIVSAAIGGAFQSVIENVKYQLSQGLGR